MAKLTTWTLTITDNTIILTMHHPSYKILSFKIVAPYTLDIVFNDETKQRINFEPVLYGEMYGPLRDITVFNQVNIDPEVKTLVWSNGADFDPAILHNWDENVDELIHRAESWEAIVS